MRWAGPRRWRRHRGAAIGIDAEFWESSLIPTIVVSGFLGLSPTATELAIHPQLPEACPEMGVSNIPYGNVRLDVKAAPN